MLRHLLQQGAACAAGRPIHIFTQVFDIAYVIIRMASIPGQLIGFCSIIAASMLQQLWVWPRRFAAPV
jgi:hypothetical protein